MPSTSFFSQIEDAVDVVDRLRRDLHSSVQPARDVSDEPVLDAGADVDFDVLIFVCRTVAIALLDDLGGVGAVDDSASFVVHGDLENLLFLVDQANALREDRDALVHQIEGPRLGARSFQALANVAIDEAIETDGLACVSGGADPGRKVRRLDSEPVLVDGFENGVGNLARLERVNPMDLLAHWGNS